MAGFEDLAWWIEHDRVMAMRIVRLIREVQCDPFQGIGKPERLSKAIYPAACPAASTRSTGWSTR
jgi:Txe/YoeB family toxin of Txe-Axe toxin-antitoxin module